MSTPVGDIISAALYEIGDPNGKSTKRPAMLGFYNRAQRKLARGLRCLETDYYFNLQANEPRYYYPDDNIQISGIRISQVAQPSSLGDYYWLRERFRDEWRNATDGYRPSSQVWGYHARANWFELLDAPVADVDDGGIVTTWHLPQEVVTETSATLMELPDSMRDAVQEGMQILARLTGRERAAAMDDWKRWVDEIEAEREKFEDRSDDRRSSIRPPGGEDWTVGMR